MKVRVQTGGLAPPVELKGVRNVVIFDDCGNPLLVAQTLGKDSAGTTIVYSHKDPEFRRILKLLGIGLNTQYRIIEHASS
jgi:hypothetical protein